MTHGAKNGGSFSEMMEPVTADYTVKPVLSNH